MTIVAITAVLTGCAMPPEPASTGAASADPRPAPSMSSTACAFPSASGASAPKPADETYLDGTGRLRVLVLPVDFTDAPATTNAAGVLSGAEGGGALVSRFSQDQLDVEYETHAQWTRMSAPSVDYGLVDGATYDEHRVYLGEALAAADEAVDFTGYGAVFVVAATGASVSGASVFTASEGDLTTAEGTIPFAAHFGDVSVDERTVAHETLHLIGLPDLYPYDPAAAPGGTYVGGWDIMGNTQGAYPTPFAWQQWQAGWIGDDQLACLESGAVDQELTAVGSEGGTKAVVVPTGDTTALVVESRRGTVDPAASEPAAGCGEGALVYRVDLAAASGQGPIVVVGPRPEQDAALTCGELGDSTLIPDAAGRESWTDESSGVTVELLAADAEGDTVRVTRP